MATLELFTPMITKYNVHENRIKLSRNSFNGMYCGEDFRFIMYSSATLHLINFNLP